MSSKSNSKLILDDDILSTKEMTEFRSSKSISLASRISGVKDTLVSELLEFKPVSDVMFNLCTKKIEKSRYIQPDTGEKKKIDKNTSKEVCQCLFQKNKELSINELQQKTRLKLETPGSECIKILDKKYYK